MNLVKTVKPDAERYAEMIAAEPPTISNDVRKYAANYALAYVLLKYGISQNRIAGVMGCARSTVNQWANGVSEMLSNAPNLIGHALKDLQGVPGDEIADDFWFLYRNYSLGK